MCSGAWIGLPPHCHRNRGQSVLCSSGVDRPASSLPQKPEVFCVVLQWRGSTCLLIVTGIGGSLCCAPVAWIDLPPQCHSKQGQIVLCSSGVDRPASSLPQETGAVCVVLPLLPQDAGAVCVVLQWRGIADAETNVPSVENQELMKVPAFKF